MAAVRNFSLSLHFDSYNYDNCGI